jgi:hypothetical protein
VGYEVFIVVLGSSFGPVRNGVELLFKRPFTSLGIDGGIGVLAVFGGGLAILLWIRRRRSAERLRLRWFSWMFLESVTYAFLIGIVVGRATERFLQAADTQAVPNVAARFALALGAGAYEEILFRAILLGGLLWLFQKVLTLSRSTALLSALGLSSLLFSASHYVLLANEAFTPTSFVFRLLAGVAFGTVYLMRGVGIAAYSHSLYNIFLVLHG